MKALRTLRFRDRSGEMCIRDRMPQLLPRGFHRDDNAGGLDSAARGAGTGAGDHEQQHHHMGENRPQGKVCLLYTS